MGFTNEPQVYVGLLGDLMDGETDVLDREPGLARKAREVESLVELKTNQIKRHSDKLNLFESNLNKFLGPGTRSLSRPPRYNLEKLRQSEEFAYTTLAVQRSMGSTLLFINQVTDALQDFLAVLEEYE